MAPDNSAPGNSGRHRAPDGEAQTAYIPRITDASPDAAPGGPLAPPAGLGGQGGLHPATPGGAPGGGAGRPARPAGRAGWLQYAPTGHALTHAAAGRAAAHHAADYAATGTRR